MWSRKKKQDERKLAILIDYKNVAMAPSTDKGKVLDFLKLREECLKIGSIVEAYVFVPDHWARELPLGINRLGFEILTCQGIRNGSSKIEDQVDIHIIKKAVKILNLIPAITDMVLVGHDGHMMYWLTEAQLRRKKVHIFAGETLSRFFKKVVPAEDIHLLPVCQKN